MLITEAKYAQIQCDLLSQFKKPFKTLGAIIIPIVVFVAKKISETATETQMLNGGINNNLNFIGIFFTHIFFRTYCKRYILYRL